MRLSIVIPAFNEQPCLHELFAALDAAIRNDLNEIDVEVIVVDDHSTDATPTLLEANAKTYSWLKYLRLLRNSGSHVAILAGLSVCTGDVAYTMGADLQDPPEVIPKFLAEHRLGHKIVLGERETRDDPISKVIPSRIFNSFMNKFVQKSFPAGGGDVFLLDRGIINAVIQCNEKNVNIFVLMLSICSDVGRVKYQRQRRVAGESKFDTTKLIKLAFDSVITTGYFPLKAIFWLGFATFLTSILIIIYLIVVKLMGWVDVPGWASVMVLISVFGGLHMISIAVIGEYLWRNLDQTRGRPIFIIEKSNLESSPAPKG